MPPCLDALWFRVIAGRKHKDANLLLVIIALRDGTETPGTALNPAGREKVKVGSAGVVVQKALMTRDCGARTRPLVTLSKALSAAA